MPAEPSAFGRGLRMRRLAAGLTQAELAEKSGISERTVSDLERGTRPAAYPSTARRLAAALGVSALDEQQFLAEALGAVPSEQRAALPVPLTRLLGRQTELVMVRSLLADSEVRLITIVGSGGIGKTRLALEAALLGDAGFPAGAFFVNLSETRDPAMVLPALARAMGVVHAGGDLAHAVSRRVGGRRALVLMDTFEHLLAAAADLGGFLTTCRSVTVLTTSRAPLRVRGEREVPLRPLAESAAVELFVERARAVSPAFTPSAPELSVARQICSRLDGIPLAIELAAARVRHLTVHDVLTQLPNSLSTLVGGARDLPRRQRTMRATLDWSYELLDPDQMRHLRALSTFRGTFNLEAAAAMVGSSGPPAAELGALLEASLVTGETAASGQGRFRLLDVTREYALERAAAAGESAGLQRRHALHFLEVAERAEPQMRGVQQRPAFVRLLDDEANFRAALLWALEVGEGDLALRLAGALWMFWRWAGLFGEARALLDAALAAGDNSSIGARCQGLWGAGWLAYHQGDYARTAEVGARMLEILGESGPPILRRNGLTLIGNAAMARGRSPEALVALERALRLCEPAGTSWHLATSLLNYATALLNAHRGPEAGAIFERALAIYESLGDQHFAARTRIQLAYTALEAQDRARARALAALAMRTIAGLGDAWSLAEGLEATAAIEAVDGPRESALLAGAAARLRERIGMLAQPQDAIVISRELELARRLTPEFAAAFAEGQAMNLDEAIRIAQGGHGRFAQTD